MFIVCLALFCQFSTQSKMKIIKLCSRCLNVRSPSFMIIIVAICGMWVDITIQIPSNPIVISFAILESYVTTLDD